MTTTNRIVANAEQELMGALDTYVTALMDEDIEIKDSVERILALQAEENEEDVSALLSDIIAAAAGVAISLLIPGRRWGT